MSIAVIIILIAAIALIMAATAIRLIRKAALEKNGSRTKTAFGRVARQLQRNQWNHGDGDKADRVPAVRAQAHNRPEGGAVVHQRLLVQQRAGAALQPLLVHLDPRGLRLQLALPALAQATEVLQQPPQRDPPAS